VKILISLNIFDVDLFSYEMCDASFVNNDILGESRSVLEFKAAACKQVLPVNV
jgi:hypothetical protein